MRQWTAGTIEDALNDRGLALTNRHVAEVLAQIVNGEPPIRKQSSEHDCIVHWSPMWKKEMDAWEILA